MTSFVGWRRRAITEPVFRRMRAVFPAVSETERDALEAGDVWWDAALFSGNPDWRELWRMPPARVSDEERAFLDGPVAELCALIDDWRINTEHCDLPPEVWTFMRERGFFGMIIPERYGGLGFSATAQSEVVRKVASRSLAAAVTVMVPNALGPGELLLRFGTDAQRDRWLPRLADGTEIPCFGLTSAVAGSDAAAIEDRGVVCRGEQAGEEAIGIRLDWDKRYITLAPIATVLGLAFRLHDPDGMLGGDEDRGITLALVPTDLPGVEIGRRHLPAMQMFQNGPTRGRGVFVPLDAVIGEEAGVGDGWRMLVNALAAGRGLSLPSVSAAAAVFGARTTGAYARVREQFGRPVGRFEGVQRRLARLAATAYQLDAARRLTCAAIDEGLKPAVISAIVKVHATYRMREAVDDAMDVHAGKAIMDGPLNYLGNAHRSVPVSITVEGANILTRHLIVFGQGAIRCHPFLREEMLALGDEDRERALARFDATLWPHAGHALATLARAFARTWTGGVLAPAPEAGPAARWCRQLSRYAAAFALVAEVALVALGGAIKKRELISARLGDVLSELYLLSAVLVRYRAEGAPREDAPLVEYCMRQGLATIEDRLDGVLANLPARTAAWLARTVVMPLGRRHTGPDDRLVRTCASILLEPSAARDRLTAGLYLGANEHEGIARLERAFSLVASTERLRRRMRELGFDDAASAREAGVLEEAEAARLEEADAAVRAVVEVDSFDPSAFGALLRGEQAQEVATSAEAAASGAGRR